ncbi:hypothetical protein [Flavobacterium lindanitolerans]|uniref:hypothetical protein n=1 Tax=Flavobacterium lindanitolerans TaxID=428988 RepID=UPI0023F47667|nr:hypothetical protein [Flavobacterium lindanitolerans]
MSIEDSFNSECENIFLKNKFLLERKLKIKEGSKDISFDDFPIFHEMFESHQKELAFKLMDFLEANNNLHGLQDTLQPIANYYIASFLNMVNFPKLE